jgi:histidine triad (HIT) family protein
MLCILARRWEGERPGEAKRHDPPGWTARGAGPVTNEGCVFDAIVDGSAPAHVVLDDGALLAFLDARPVFPGHTLVVPKEHWVTMADLPPALLGPLLEAGRQVAAAQRSALGAEGTFLAFNDVVSQSVPHVHLHVVPRRRGDGLRGFFWPRSRYSDQTEAAEIAARLRSALSSA